MGHNASRRGAANLGMPLMIAAFIVIGGFLYWLYLQAEAERQLELQEAARIAAEEAEREAMGEILAPSALQLDASPYEGRIVSLEDVEVASAQVPHLLSIIAERPGSLVITHAHRQDVILALIATSESVTFPLVPGVLLTGAAALPAA